MDLVEPGAASSGGPWRVLSTDQRTGQVKEEAFDAIFVCNGHYAVPHYGEIEGIEKFEVQNDAIPRSFFLPLN